MLLKEQYKNYSFINFEPLFLHDDYFVLKKENEVVAGIRANITQWKMRHLPGIYCKSGNEKDLFVLMESVCAELKLHTGMIWMDPESELYGRIKEAGNWGIMNRMKEKIPVNVVAAFRNIPEKEQLKFRQYPVYISAFDLT